MIYNDLKIKNLMHGDFIEQLANQKMISISEARELVSHMSFTEYCTMVEDIAGPSGSTIGPTGTVATPSNATQATNAPNQAPGQSNIKSIWPGKGAPPEVGMTVGIKGPNGLPVPGTISQVDSSAKGVKIKNPTTGQEEWTNIDALQPFMAQGNATQPPATGQTTNQATNQPNTQVAEDTQSLIRMRQLAGIKENCSAGATGAGSIAIAPTSTGTMKKRTRTEEQFAKEYEPKEAPKTIVGDTKPAQASGELSSNLAVRGKKTATRTNNGFKR